MRVLDEVAEATRRARGPGRRPVLTPFGLEEQFDRPLTPREWNPLRRHLACRLPPLAFAQGHWFLPAGLETIWDLVDRAAPFHPDWEPPGERTEAAWQEAQIFAGVKIALVDGYGIPPHLVVRSARVVEDLGLY
jgi:hypothetical protein